MRSLIELENKRMAWALQTFPEATAISSLRKLEEEIKEIEADINNGKIPTMEYVDALMCLLDSAGRVGVFLPEIIIGFEAKLKINEGRIWKKNPDNSYSHIKQVSERCDKCGSMVDKLYEGYCKKCSDAQWP